MISLTVNRRVHEIDASPDMPLLWVLRDLLGLTGTKFGCGVAQCGACTVHLNGEAVRSCVTRVSRAAGKEVVIVEELSANNDHPLQLAWAEFDGQDAPPAGETIAGPETEWGKDKTAIDRPRVLGRDCIRGLESR